MRRLLAALMMTVPMAAFAVVPVSGATPPGTPVTINAGPGDQFDPHVNEDLAAYSSDRTIRYYRFSTAVDLQIPNPTTARDVLSDVSGARVVFARIDGVTNKVLVFDTATSTSVELNPEASSNRFGASIGRDTVAYIDFGFVSGKGELVIYDLATNSSVRATNDAAYDQNPNVSHDGNVVTWERCTSSIVNCDVLAARKTGSGWITQVVSDTAAAEMNPDTNGSLVVYDVDRGGATGMDIGWKSLTGDGTETRLELAGFEYNPSISGNVIAFEHQDSISVATDLYVYNLATNALYRLTNTVDVNETLNDVSVLSDGRVRLVWTTDEDGVDARNVRGVTFSLPTPPPPPPPVCANRTVTLEAKKTYFPSHATDASSTQATVFRFSVPATLEITQGRAFSSDHAELSFRNGTGTEFKCRYRGDYTSSGKSKDDDDDDDDHHGKKGCIKHHTHSSANVYRFEFCTPNGPTSVTNGTVVSATTIKLHIIDGYSFAGTTKVKAVLREICPTAAFLEGFEFGALTVEGTGVGDVVTLDPAITAEPLAPEAMGCSAAGSESAIAALIAIAIAWLLQARRKPVPVRERR